MYKVTADTKQKLYETFNTTEQMVENDVNIIKTWIKTQPHLPEMMEDVKIKNFLCLNKFSIEKTKLKIDMYYMMRSVAPEIFEKSNPKLDNIKRVFKTMYMSTFPVLLNDTHRVYFNKAKIPDVYSPQDLAKLYFAIFEVRLYEELMIDDVPIFDMKGLSLNDMKITPTILAKKVYALRLHKVVFLNCPSYVFILVNILKFVVQPKIFERMQFHQDDAAMKKMFSKEVLPKEYGGDGPSLEELNEIMMKKLDEYQERFDKLDSLKVDESLRPEKLNNDEILGFYGSFKKLTVD